jgi:hypothetical protein
MVYSLSLVLWAFSMSCSMVYSMEFAICLTNSTICGVFNQALVSRIMMCMYTMMYYK